MSRIVRTCTQRTSKDNDDDDDNDDDYDRVKVFFDCSMLMPLTFLDGSACE